MNIRRPVPEVGQVHNKIDLAVGKAEALKYLLSQLRSTVEVGADDNHTKLSREVLFADLNITLREFEKALAAAKVELTYGGSM